MTTNQDPKQTPDSATDATPPVTEAGKPIAPPVPPADEDKPAAQPAPIVLAPDRPPSKAIKRAIDVITRSAVVESNLPEADTVKKAPNLNTPWALEQFFNGEIDLDVELAQRFPNMPMMSVISFREMGEKTKRGVASLSTQDGSAGVHIDVDGKSRVIQLSFSFGSMLTLRFRMDTLSDMDRKRWLELMQRDQGGLAFLWGPDRWETDYMICVVRRYFTNLYTFSPYNFEAAIRMTPEVTTKLLTWLEKMWNMPDTQDADPDAPLLTW